ncbi:hypothetical protein PFICI_11694 [Pestalotiopsis fici W106-1]|uniref:Rhodopsin domain-containing protein n=1 Tax=Pestalotiopsis fici (strain W106-1 / CGMCC3.15140) TaxID=1229662 RepID=W3WT49_PESFW|nr:uncharacterized protein PFICI_11694 [Pestalotiopsis fici W106-1]ETS76307.1 hypothetical protein PFICI_11694 [Pestalotiopsis fici W106-1]
MADTVDTRSNAVLVIVILGSILSTAALLVRVYSRHVLLHTFGKDDALMIAGWVFLIATAVAVGLEYHFGMGKHRWDITHDDYVSYMKASAFLTSTVVYSVAIYLVKISIILQYCRIFKDTRFYRFYFGVMLLLAVWTVVMSFLLIFICVPVRRFWDENAPGKCMNMLALWLSVAVINMITDLTCFLIPIPPLLQLQMSRNNKILLSAIFALALCPCAISAYRVKTLIAVASSSDLSWENNNTALFTFLELCTGAVAACLPACRPVLAKLMPRLFTSSTQLRSANSVDLQSHHHRQTQNSHRHHHNDDQLSQQERRLSVPSSSSMHGKDSIRGKSDWGSTRELNLEDNDQESL